MSGGRKLDYQTLSPGRELDALIAEKVMGGNIKHIFNGDAGCWSCGVYDYEKASDRPCVPNYSTDIAAAWTVVEKFHHWRLEKDENGKEYEACLLYKDEAEGVFFNYFGRSDSMAHAICLAALKSVGD